MGREDCFGKIYIEDADMKIMYERQVGIEVMETSDHMGNKQIWKQCP